MHSRKIVSVLAMMLVLLLCSPVLAFAASSNDASTAAPALENEADLADEYAFMQKALDSFEQDISETGMTSYIDDNGFLQVVELVPSVLTRSVDGPVSQDVALSCIALVDSEGALASGITYNDYRTDTGSDAQYQIYATHKAYFTLVQDSLLDGFDVRLTKMTTTLNYASVYKATGLVHTYIGYRDQLYSDYESSNSSVMYPEENKTYTFAPKSSYYSMFSGAPNGRLISQALIDCEGRYIKLECFLSLQDETFLQALNG